MSSNHYKRHMSLRLPSEEHKFLQSKAHLESHFRSPRASGDYADSTRSSRSSSSYRSQAQRLKDSEIRYSTRNALTKGAACDRAIYGSGSPDGEYDRPIPGNYLDEYNRMMYEDDMAHDADQYKADLTRGAAWRKHRSLGTEDVQDMMRHMNLYDDAYGADSSRKLPKYKEKDRRPVPMIGDAVTPLKSQFDWDSSSDEEEDEVDERPHSLQKRNSLLRTRRS